MNRVDEFFSMLLWAVERKDFEDFWPVGLESTGPRYWPQLVLDLERILMNTGEFKEPDYPTANVALVFCLIYGMRELNWNYEKSSHLVDKLFESAQKCKHGDLFNSDHRNVLFDVQKVQYLYENGTKLLSKGITNSDVHEFSALVLALAESEFFMNHRIATEMHGPYFLEDGTVCIVRSFKNLLPLGLWKALEGLSLSNSETHMITKYQKCKTQFDILSNLMRELPNEEYVEDVSIITIDGSIAWDKEFFQKTVTELKSAIRIIMRELSVMSKEEKSEQMTRILYFGCRANLDNWEKMACRAINMGRQRMINYPVPVKGLLRLDYYNLTKSYSEKP